MLYKDDADKARERMKAFFAGEIIDRAVIQVSAPKKGVNPASAWGGWHGWYLVQHLDEPERVVDEFQKSVEATYFGGEAFPAMFVNLGPGSVAAYLGCKTTVMPDTVWFEAEPPWTWEQIQSATVDPENAWWKASLRMTKAAVERGRNNWYVEVPDLGATMSIIDSLRGTERLLMDLLESPDEVKRGADHILSKVMECYDASLRLTQRYVSGSMSWMGIWNPGRGSDVQCDFSAMISPDQFGEFVVPHLREQCRLLDHRQSIYHWDGPGQIPHLDHLLSIPELGGIQWIPGAGQEGPGSLKWLPLYKRIQAAGKLLVLQWLSPHEIEPLMRELSPKGLLMSAGCATEDEARDLLRKVEKWTHKR